MTVFLRMEPALAQSLSRPVGEQNPHPAGGALDCDGCVRCRRRGSHAGDRVGRFGYKLRRGQPGQRYPLY